MNRRGLSQVENLLYAAANCTQKVAQNCYGGPALDLELDFCQNDPVDNNHDSYYSEIDDCLNNYDGLEFLILVT